MQHANGSRIKEKLTQIKLFEEIIVGESKVQRSQSTGVLLVTMKKAKETTILVIEKKMAEEKKQKQKEEIEKVKEANINEVMIKKKKADELKQKIKEDHDLDDLPDLV